MSDQSNRIYPRRNLGRCKICNKETWLGKERFCFDCYIRSIMEDEGETGDMMQL